MRQIKALADELGISVLLVHHLRKQGDSDPLNKLSGTTGISGAMDALFILDKSRRNAAGATLICASRDTGYRELELQLSPETCVWNLVSDSLESPQLILPEEMNGLIAFMKEKISFSGTNSDFADQFSAYYGKSVSVKGFKQMMNRWRYSLEEQGVFFENRRSNGQRLLDISYFSSDGDESDVNDAKQPCGENCVPFVPCVTETPR